MIFRLVRWLFWLLTLPFRWLMSRGVRQGAYVAFEIDGGVSDYRPERRLADWVRAQLGTQSGEPFSLHDFHAQLDDILSDARIAGVVIVIRSLRAGLATAANLRTAIARIRQANKRSIVYLAQGAGTKETYVAMAADAVWMAPPASMGCVGFLSHQRYFRRAFDRASIEPEVFARGRYKSAGETLVRDSMSEPQKEQLGALLNVFDAALVESIASGRRVSEADARALVDGAPYHGALAVEKGLIDGVCYEDELPTHLASEKVSFLQSGRYARKRRVIRPPKIARPRGVAVVSIHGAIATKGPIRVGPVASEEAVISKIRGARADSRVKAVVLHIDSPGGSALASDLIHHEVVQLAKEKPTIAYLANVAASGGYYIAAGAHEVIAQPTTVTGSIGVVAARVIVDRLLDRIGVSSDILVRGAHARLLDPLLPYTEEERAVLERELDAVYADFVGVVAAGRKKTREEVHAVAEGRVWSGADALTHGLVDKFGDFEVAIEEARTRANLRPSPPVIVARGFKHSVPLAPPEASGDANGTSDGPATQLLELLGRLGFKFHELAALLGARERVWLYSGAANALFQAGADESPRATF